HGVQLLRSGNALAQPRHLHDPRSGRVRAEPRASLRLSRLLDRWLAQDALQEPLPAAGAPHLEGLGADGRDDGRLSEARKVALKLRAEFSWLGEALRRQAAGLGAHAPPIAQIGEREAPAG